MKTYKIDIICDNCNHIYQNEIVTVILNNEETTLYGSTTLKRKSECWHCNFINNISVPVNLLQYGITIKTKH